MCLKPYQGQFGKPLRHRSWLETIFIQKFKTFYPNFLKHPIFPSILIKYCLYPLFWLLTPGGPIDLITDLSSEFLLGTEIAHYKEENESLVTNIWGNTVLVMGSYKNSVTSEHPVFGTQFVRKFGIRSNSGSYKSSGRLWPLCISSKRRTLSTNFVPSPSLKHQWTSYKQISCGWKHFLMLNIESSSSLPGVISAKYSPLQFIWNYKDFQKTPI